MASPSAQREAARAPPPPDQLASFYKLVDKQVIAGVLCRHARNAELSAQAAVQAEALFGNNSLAVADLRMAESAALAELAVDASGVEQKVAFLRKSWAVLVPVNNLLLHRLSTNTLLSGTITAEEMDYEVHFKAVASKAKNEPNPCPVVLRDWASMLGYNTLMDAMFSYLDLLQHVFWAQHEREMMKSFVLQGLDVIPRTAGIPAGLIVGEDALVAKIEKRMNPHRYEPAFCAAVLRKWRSNETSSVLRARGVLQTEITTYKQDSADFEARQRADIAKHGLRDCALPSCSKTEKTVKEFAGCSGCRSVV